jgi:two-component system cell cycle sensor histidine kinase/response regulator CckA
VLVHASKSFCQRSSRTTIGPPVSARALTELGYEVLESAEPEAVSALCYRHRGRIDLLMTDFIMPRMNGSELAARVVAIRPETHVLYMSGYAQESPFKRRLGLKDSAFPSKPFTPGILEDRVREALGR